MLGNLLGTIDGRSLCPGSISGYCSLSSGCCCACSLWDRGRGVTFDNLVRYFLKRRDVIGLKDLSYKLDSPDESVDGEKVLE